jgi:uncharacterized protein YbjQ (UPF0145 family)
MEKSMTTTTFDMMVSHVEELGANAVIGVRYDVTELMGGVR